MDGSKPANCAILGVIGASKTALASKLPHQGANWQVNISLMIFPLFWPFPPFLNALFITKEGKPLRDFPKPANYKIVII